MTPERIKALRLGLGLTQAQFAKALGIKLRAVTYWEAGTPNRNPAGPALIMLHMIERDPKRLREIERIANEVAAERLPPPTKVTPRGKRRT